MFKSSTLRGLALGLAVTASTFGSLPARAETPAGTKVLLVHTNDVHGNLEPDSKGRGGMARVATLLNRLRAENPGAVAYVDLGDIAQGTPVSNIFHGEPMVAVMNYLKPVAATLGNHEFDWGVRAMEEMTGKARYPLVVANLVDGKGRLPFAPYRITRVAGVNIGFIGLMSPDTPLYVMKGNMGDYRVTDPAAAVRKYLPEMRRKWAEVIVVLAHEGVDADHLLAADVPQINLIIGGHSHTKIEAAQRVGRTAIVQADKYGRFVGVVEMTVDRHADRVLGVESRVIEINDKSGLEPDPKVVALIEKYNQKVKPVMAQVVGEAAGELQKKTGPGEADSTLGNVIADAMRIQTGSDVSVYNYGGIRDDAMAAGPITKGTVFKILPFDDQVVQIRLKGSDLLEILGQGARMKEGPLQVSGVEVVAPLEGPLEARVDGKPLDPAAFYTVATTEFMAGGGDGYQALTRGEIVKRLAVARDVFMDYLAARKVLAVPATGRIRLADKK